MHTGIRERLRLFRGNPRVRFPNALLPPALQAQSEPNRANGIFDNDFASSWINEVRGGCYKNGNFHLNPELAPCLKTSALKLF